MFTAQIPISGVKGCCLFFMCKNRTAQSFTVTLFNAFLYLIKILYRLGHLRIREVNISKITTLLKLEVAFEPTI